MTYIVNDGCIKCTLPSLFSLSVSVMFFGDVLLLFFSQNSRLRNLNLPTTNRRLLRRFDFFRHKIRTANFHIHDLNSYLDMARDVPIEHSIFHRE